MILLIIPRHVLITCLVHVSVLVSSFCKSVLSTFVRSNFFKLRHLLTQNYLQRTVKLICLSNVEDPSV